MKNHRAKYNREKTAEKFIITKKPNIQTKQLKLLKWYQMVEILKI
jgi:hypothetical protein